MPFDYFRKEKICLPVLLDRIAEELDYALFLGEESSSPAPDSSISFAALLLFKLSDSAFFLISL